MNKLAALLLCALPLAAAEQQKLEGLRVSGWVWSSPEIKSWFEVRIDNRDGDNNAELTVDAIGCNALTVRDGRQLPLQLRVPKGAKTAIVLDHSKGCEVQGPPLESFEDDREVHIASILVQGKTKGITIELAGHQLQGDQLNTVNNHGRQDKLMSQSYLEVAPGISAIMNFGNYPATAETCQRARLTVVNDTLVPDTGGMFSYRAQCADPLSFVELAPRHVVLHWFSGPSANIALKSTGKHRTLIMGSFYHADGQNQRYSADSSIRFEEPR